MLKRLWMAICLWHAERWTPKKHPTINKYKRRHEDKTSHRE